MAYKVKPIFNENGPDISQVIRKYQISLVTEALEILPKTVDKEAVIQAVIKNSNFEEEPEQ